MIRSTARVICIRQLNKVSRWLLLAVLLTPTVAFAQNPFVLRVAQGNNIAQIPNGATLAINSPSPGTSRTLQVLLTYTGSTSASFPEGVKALGSPDFRARLTSGNTSLGPFQTAIIEVSFTPSGTTPALTQLDIPYLEAPPPPAEPNAPPGQPTRGLLTLGLSGGVPVYSLNYSIGANGNTNALPPESGELIFPNTVVNSSVAAAMTLVNRGSGPGQVTSISVSGSAFSLSGLPALPAGLDVGSNLQFRLVYLPRDLGTDQGTLTIGFDGGISQIYRLQGTGILSPLSYEILPPNGDARQLIPNETIQFPQTPMGHKSELRVRFTNVSGNDSTVGNLTASGASFTISDTPSTPLSLAPGASGTVTVSFSPTQLDPVSGSLRISTDTFRLFGDASGLPGYTIAGPTQVGPLEQPAIELALNQAYPITLTGTLALGVASDHAADPSAQFSSGGRTVSFTIPANTTAAVFPNGANQIRLQTGSVASTFTLTPTFGTENGLNLTPPSPTVLRIVMPTSAPQLLGIQVAERGTSTLTLRLVGFSPVRSLGKVDFRFAAVPGFNVSNLNFTLDLAGASALWFNSSASQAFGGQFTLDVQFLLATSDTEATATAPIQALQAVSATVASSVGDSNTLSLNLR